MGVNSLWEILGPAARTVRLEALSRKRLAVDASIWIYQFLKAVRDSQGNALQSAHIVGFFRRICKLLYFGILPIFVFDGGAPALKRDVINKRRERREGKQEDATETAKRLLAIHVQRQANGVKTPSKKAPKNDEDNIVYLEDLPNQFPGTVISPERPLPEKRFTPSDEYHLPKMKKIKISETDERLIPEDEFNELTSGSFDIVDGIDINTVDPKSEAFAQLPMATQYMILSHLRLKSRLRLGFTKDQLENIFTNSLDFSKFQIQQVQRRNYYTQKLMDISGMGKDGNATRRIAGDKDRHYQLIRSDNGWTLSLGKGEGSSENPVALDDFDDVDLSVNPTKASLNEQSAQRLQPASDPVTHDSDSDEFEDVDLNQEETAEEKEFQSAVIKSIYEQYQQDEQDIDLKKMDKSIEGVSDFDLERAIELSKKEYFALQEGEQELSSTGKLPELDFSSSLLFGAGKSQPEPNKSATKPKRPVQPVVNIEEPNVTKKDALGSSGQAKRVSFADPKEPASKKDTKTKAMIETEALIEGFDDDEEFEDVEEVSSEKKEKPANVIPEWFNTKVDETAYKREPENIKKPEPKPEQVEEEETGLISWEDAKKYLDEPQEDTERPNDNKDIPEEDLVVEIDEKKFKHETSEPEVIGEVLDNGKVTETGQKPEKEKSNETNEQAKTKKAESSVLDYVFVDDEDEMLDEQLASEHLDHEDLKKEIKASQDVPLGSIHTKITNEQLLQEKLQRAKRDAEEVTQTMINDVQELLKRFGIPFITAPMEAEAQCAALLNLGLVDGIITDDSDCFLFGGDRIYKNMFNQKQYVECYLKDDLHSKLGLSQNRLIELGLLLGSDYTEGIKGVGPVLAMEVLAEFGSLVGFKKWFEVNAHTTKGDASTSLKKNLTNRIRTGRLYLPGSFPDQVVFDAYVQPEVDDSKEEFKWGVPDLDQIRSFLMYNVGWSQERVDEVMVPLIRDMNRKRREGTQSTIGEFFPTAFTETRKELQVGKRLKAAANKLNKKTKT